MKYLLSTIPLFMAFSLSSAFASIKTYKNIHYGKNERQIFDIWMPKSQIKTPLVIYIHGGGFSMGSKDEITSHSSLINKMASNNIAFAAINYRFIQTTPLQTILKEDIAGFIQYIKYKSKTYNIDKNKIMVYGESAGGSASLWVGTHPDLKNSVLRDPIKRESSRVFAFAHINAQLSYDFIDWYSFYGTDIVKKYLKKQVYSRYHFKSYDQLFTKEGLQVRKSLNMYDNITQDDPPMLFWNNLKDDIDKDYNHFIHSPQHAKNLYRRAHELGISTKLYTKENIGFFQDKHFTVLDFFLKELKKK